MVTTDYELVVPHNPDCDAKDHIMESNRLLENEVDYGWALTDIDGYKGLVVNVDGDTLGGLEAKAAGLRAATVDSVARLIASAILVARENDIDGREVQDAIDRLFGLAS